eukprot:SAG22_NODE_15850_length_339_cov_2.397490_1_plen_72_part_10
MSCTEADRLHGGSLCWLTGAHALTCDKTRVDSYEYNRTHMNPPGGVTCLVCVWPAADSISASRCAAATAAAE